MKQLLIRDEISSINRSISELKAVVSEEGKKYAVNTASFKEIRFCEELAEKIEKQISLKLINMDQEIDINELLNEIINSNNEILKSVNEPILKIKQEISSIRSKRMNINKKIAEHLMRKLWDEESELRNNYIKTVEDIDSLNKEINQLEQQENNQDTIRSVFNGLIDFLGLSEYYLDSNKKLMLRLSRDYDISKEGGRISSAQKKMLSLCYFFAEIISEIKSTTELKKYILLFDDPVDSADYNYFHSIAALLENIEIILNNILRKRNIKIGQIIVMTHNSLLYDRLTKSFELRRTMKKTQNNTTQVTNAEKTVNNYKIYLEYIIRYYKNPRNNRKDMIFVGNMIRRILEIISNFNNLGNNDFTKYMLDIGKPKLALLANHLSHESFTKVLNPLNSEKELQEACKELLDVIKLSHPEQYKYIEKEMM